jgi:hypothetical protein
MPCVLLIRGASYAQAACLRAHTALLSELWARIALVTAKSEDPWKPESPPSLTLANWTTAD